jgi:hypothetical protein
MMAIALCAALKQTSASQVVELTLPVSVLKVRIFDRATARLTCELRIDSSGTEKNLMNEDLCCLKLRGCTAADPSAAREA